MRPGKLKWDLRGTRKEGSESKEKQKNFIGGDFIYEVKLPFVKLLTCDW